MTDDEAISEASRRWGALGVARDRGEDCADWMWPRYVVGKKLRTEPNTLVIHGEGSTWLEAFDEATERAEFLDAYGFRSFVRRHRPVVLGTLGAGASTAVLGSPANGGVAFLAFFAIVAVVTIWAIQQEG